MQKEGGEGKKEVWWVTMVLVVVVGGDSRGTTMVGCDWLSIKIEEPTEITPDSDVQDSVEVHKEENWMRNDRVWEVQYTIMY